MATQKPVLEWPAFVIDASTGDIIETNTTAIEAIRLMREMSEDDCERVVQIVRAVADGSWPYSMDDTKSMSGKQAREAVDALATRSLQ